MGEQQEDLRKQLVNGFQTLPGFAGLRADFSRREPSAIFNALFPIAIEFTGDCADQVAGRLLVDLEPTCPMSCRDALLMVAFGEWNLSDRLVPFYLVTQFGKREVLRAADELLAEGGLSGSQVTAVTGVTYWVGFPTVHLLEPFVSWRTEQINGAT